MTGAARRAREREQSAAEAFPLVIGLFRFDPPVERKPPACRTDERPLMCALVGRVTAARPLNGRLSPASWASICVLMTCW